MTGYDPSPIDTEKVHLTPDQRRLIEQLTENAHEIWAAKRLADGWRWGAARDDANKLHPCLVPFSELPDSEKAYDREIVEQTIKAALAIGYSVTKA